MFLLNRARLAELAAKHRLPAMYGYLPSLAAELVRLKVDVIVTSGMPAGLAAKRATTTIPIVLAVVGDVMGAGLVPSLARPGGNITGLSNIGAEITGKQ